MKKLILTEKPSVARDFAQALGKFSKGDGLFESDEYIITWAIGHLLTPFDPEHYDKSLKKWTLESLPILPTEFKYNPVYKTKKQLSIVTRELRRKDLSEVIIATDAGREGELIARTILERVRYLTVSKKRFWTSQALTKDVILSTMKSMPDLKQFDRLFMAGKYRQQADWLVGMNLSRAATLKLGEIYSVGRVQTAVLALLVRRRLEIDYFRPEKYFQILGNFIFNSNDINATWYDLLAKENSTKIDTLIKMNKICEEIENETPIIKKHKTDKKIVPPPELFSLTELQRTANRIFGFTAKKTLELAQALYERHKCLSYPRTDSKVLGTQSLDIVKDSLEKIKPNYDDCFSQIDNSKISLNNKRVFNDAKLTDHHALIPLGVYRGKSNDERRLFDLVAKRFISAFSKDHIYEDQTIEIGAGLHRFKAKGKVVIDLGFKALWEKETYKGLPNVSVGDKGSIKKLNPQEKLTTAPSEYTDSSILYDMTNPAKLVKETDLKKIYRGEIGIGTQATRAQILETLLKRNYITRDKKSLIATKKGIELIKILKDFKSCSKIISASETARWEQNLSSIASGEDLETDFIEDVKKFVTQSVEDWKTIETRPKVKGVYKKGKFSKKPSKSIGDCPKCNSGEVIAHTKLYFCTKWKDGCDFKIWKKENGKAINIKEAKSRISAFKAN